MILTSEVQPQSSEYRSNKAHHEQLRDELLQKLEAARQGGGAKRVAQQRQRGKLTARERIVLLKDPGAQELELSQLAGHELYDEQVACGGIITTITRVCDRSCMIMAHDQTVKAGSYFPVTVKKHLRAQEIAASLGLVCLYLVDSGGAYLPKQSEVFADAQHFGRIFFNQARMSAAGIPQLSSIHGSCIAGGAYIPAMSEYTVMVRGQGRIFLAGPALVKAATGEEVSAEELGGAQVHATQSGLVDELCEDDEQALKRLRAMVARLPAAGHGCQQDFASSLMPRYEMEDLLGVMPQTPKSPWPGYELLARLLDDSAFDPFKEAYGSTLITGFGRIAGIAVGILMNQGVLGVSGARKGCHFIDLCQSRGTPLIFLQNISGFMVGREAEAEGIAKEGAKMVQAVACAEVPKITVIIGGSHGAGNYAMCGRAFAADFLFTWPQARISVMGAEQAWSVLQSRSGNLSSQALDRKKKTFFERWQQESSPYYATARLWDDGLIDPLKTREVLSLALAATLTKPRKKFSRGVIRM